MAARLNITLRQDASRQDAQFSSSQSKTPSDKSISTSPHLDRGSGATTAVNPLDQEFPPLGRIFQATPPLGCKDARAFKPYKKDDTSKKVCAAAAKMLQPQEFNDYLPPTIAGAPSELMGLPQPTIEFIPPHPIPICQTTPPCMLNKAVISIDSMIRLNELSDKKVIIKAKEPKFFPSLDILGEIPLKTFLEAFKTNIETSYPNVTSDIRVVGSGANSILFNTPTLDELKDIDIAYYLSYCPIDEYEMNIFLQNIGHIFITTLASFVQNPPDNELLSLIKNNYLTKYKVVNDENNKWLLVGCDILDLRVSAKSQREYSSIAYSNQVSLQSFDSYCLYDDKNEAYEALKEKKLAVPNPHEMPNCLGRILLELLRSDSFSISDLTKITESFLQTSSVDLFITSLKNHLTLDPTSDAKNHLSKDESFEKRVLHIVSFLQAINQLSQPNTSSIFKKAFYMLINELKIQNTTLFFEDHLLDLFKELTSRKYFSSAEILFKLINDIAPKNYQKYLTFLKEINFTTLLSKTKSDETTKEFFKKIIFSVGNEISLDLIKEQDQGKKAIILNDLFALYEISQKSTIFDESNLERLTLNISHILNNANMPDEALKFLLSLPKVLDQKRLYKLLIQNFSKYPIDKKIQIFNRYSPIITTSLDKESLANLFLTFLNEIKQNYLDHPLDNSLKKDQNYLLDKAYSLNLYTEKNFVNFITQYLANYQPSSINELFLEEEQILQKYLCIKELNIGSLIQELFLIKNFSKYLEISSEKDDITYLERAFIIKDDPSYLAKALNIYYSNPNLQKDLFPSLVDYLKKKVSSKADLFNIFPLFTKLISTKPSVLTPLLKNDFSSIIKSLKIKDLDSFKSYINFLDFFVTNKYDLDEDAYKKPLEYIEDAIKIAQDKNLSLKDALNTFFILQKTAFFRSEILLDSKKKLASVFFSKIKFDNIQNFIDYLQLLDLFISESIPLKEEVFKAPIAYLQNEIPNLQTQLELVKKDLEPSNSLTQEFLIKDKFLTYFKILQGHDFWRSTLVDLEKSELFFSILNFFSSNIEKIPLFLQLLKRKISFSLEQYPLGVKNPWIDLSFATYQKIHKTLLNFLDQNEFENNYIKINEFYDFLREFKITKAETFLQKKEIFCKTFENFMNLFDAIKLSFDDEDKRVEILAQTFMSWIRAIELPDKLKFKDFDEITEVIAYNFSKYFQKVKVHSIEYFYSYLKKMNLDSKLDKILKSLINQNLEEVANLNSEPLPPQSIIQAIVKTQYDQKLYKDKKHYTDL